MVDHREWSPSSGRPYVIDSSTRGSMNGTDAADKNDSRQISFIAEVSQQVVV